MPTATATPPTVVHPTHCADCGAALPPVPVTGGSGYATVDHGTSAARHICYPCAAKREREQMIRTGRAVLYEADHRDAAGQPLAPMTRPTSLYLTDWTGALRFEQVGEVRHGRHNLAGTRLDVWFTGPEGAEWHGWRAGDNGTYLHCRRNGPIPARFLAAHPAYAEARGRHDRRHSEAVTPL